MDITDKPLPEIRTTCAIAVMGKAPRSGSAKTRLAPIIGADAAAALSAAFLRDTTANVIQAGQSAPIRSIVAYAPCGLESLLQPLLAAGTSMLLADGQAIERPGVEGFGRCLLQTVEALFDAGYGSVCVLNSDGPTLPTAYLVAAARLLGAPGDRAVLGPTEDGGYYLLGLKRPHAALFRNISWSTSVVAAETRARAAEIGLEIAALPKWFDIDDGPALEQLVISLETAGHDGFPAPATRAALRALGLLTPVACEG